MRTSFYFLFLFLISACTSSTDSAEAQTQQKISQFEKAGLCDLLIDKSGVYHAVFEESPDIGKPVFIYYAASSNKGATWSKPITLSNDNTGNGSGYPRILQDGNGRVYAIWKRYGATKAQYPKAEGSLDGPGGGDIGTLFYKVLSGGAWSNQVQLNELELAQETWFATITSDGFVRVFWAQASSESVKNSRQYWYYCDYLRTAALNGTSFSTYTDLSVPSKPTYEGGYPAEKKGAINLNGYVDKSGQPHLIYEDNPDNIQQIKYFDGKSERIVYSYPQFKQGNTFRNPPKLLVDEKGIDHLIFVPSPATLESEQIWDINLAANQTNVLTAIQVPGVSITGFQATQGPNGQMAVTFQVYTKQMNQEAYGMFYNKGNWQNVGQIAFAYKKLLKVRKNFITAKDVTTSYVISITIFNPVDQSTSMLFGNAFFTFAGNSLPLYLSSTLLSNTSLLS